MSTYYRCDECDLELPTKAGMDAHNEAQHKKDCSSCRFLDPGWIGKRSCFAWIPTDHACLDRHPAECGPQAEWSRWKQVKLLPGEDYWTGKIKE